MSDLNDTNGTLISFPVRVREVRNFSERRRADEAWRTRLNSDTATREDLVIWVLTIDNPEYDAIPGSMGMEWIQNHPQKFKELVGDVDDFILELLIRIEEEEANPKDDTVQENNITHLAWWFFKSFTCSRELVEFLSPGMREFWLSDIYPRFGSYGSDWIGNFLYLGVRRELIAGAIIKELLAGKVTASFLRFGSGHDPNAAPIHHALWCFGLTRPEMDRLRPELDRDPTTGFREIERRFAADQIPRENEWYSFRGFAPWWVLTNEELVTAFMFCAEHEPNQTIAVLDSDLLQKRLGPDKIQEIFRRALPQVTSLADLNIEDFERKLTLADLEMVAKQLTPVKERYLEEPTAQFLFRIVCELHPSLRGDFWVETVEQVLKEASSPTAYKAWRKLGLTEANIEATLRRWLDQDGYVLGRLQAGTVPSGKRAGQRQWFVDVNGFHYVCDAGHRYYLETGDEVIFNLERAHRLTPRVFVVIMTPVMKDD